MQWEGETDEEACWPEATGFHSNEHEGRCGLRERRGQANQKLFWGGGKQKQQVAKSKVILSASAHTDWWKHSRIKCIRH